MMIKLKFNYNCIYNLNLITMYNHSSTLNPSFFLTFNPNWTKTIQKDTSSIQPLHINIQ